MGAECSSAVIIYTPVSALVGFRLAAAAFTAFFARFLTEILLDDTPQAFPGVDQTVQRVQSLESARYRLAAAGPRQNAPVAIKVGLGVK